MNKPFEHHPFSEIFPLREGQSLIELSDDIKAHGQAERIVLLNENGKRRILAGRRRQLACIRAGVVPLYRDFGDRPEDGDDPLHFAFLDYHRRDDLTRPEKCEAAVKYANFRQGENQHKRKQVDANERGSTPACSQKEAATKLGVPLAAVKRAKVILEKGVPELIAAYRAETVSVSDAAAIADESPDVQRQALKLVTEKKATTLKGAVESISGPAPETASMIVRDLEDIIERLGRLVTTKGKGRDQLVKLYRDSLVHVRAL